MASNHDLYLISMRVLEGEFHEGDRVVVDVGDNELTFEKAGTQAAA